MRIKTFLNAVRLVNERLQDKVGNLDALPAEVFLSLFESDHYRLRENEALLSQGIKKPLSRLFFFAFCFALPARFGLWRRGS